MGNPILQEAFAMIPKDLKYTEEHEWVRVDGENVVVGITDHAQSALGDVVFLELPEEGRKLERGKPFGVVESVKAVSDLYAPVDGEVIELNRPLVNAPEALNKDDVVTSQVGTLLVPFASVFTGKPAGGLTQTVLAQTSPNAMLVDLIIATLSGEPSTRGFQPSGTPS
jgi:glycine cleavage system H protein